MRTDPFQIYSTSFRVGLRRTACSFLCNFSSFEVMESVQTNNNFFLLCTQLRDRSLALFHACAKMLHSLNNRVLKQQFDAVSFLPLCYIFDGLSPDLLQTQTNAQKTQIVVRCSSKEKILKVRRFIHHFLCIS